MKNIEIVYFLLKIQDHFRNWWFNKLINQPEGVIMKKLFVFAAAVTISTSVLAGNMSENRDMKAMHSQMMNKESVENILQNDDMQRLHRDMTRHAISEVGMEARLQMMTNEGRAYHKSLENKQKNTAG